jgi:ferric-dicitrate binding protein FerR (iron transport regulator)
LGSRRWWLLLGAGGLGVAALVLWTEREHVARTAQESGPLHVAVPAGAPARTIPLADGSRVTLAPGSSIDSRGPFGGAARTVDMQGEAVFTVAPGEAPFVVFASGVRVEDVSTAFLVRSLPVREGGRTVPGVLVTVTEGSVRVSAHGFAWAVSEGRGLMVDSAGGHVAMDHDEALKSVAWTGGALLFEQELMPEVVERLERWTGFRIVLDSAFRATRLSTAIEGASPTDMLEQVAQALHGRAIAHGDHWELRPN